MALIVSETANPIATFFLTNLIPILQFFFLTLCHKKKDKVKERFTPVNYTSLLLIICNYYIDKGRGCS